jgi:hypothetical protein
VPYIHTQAHTATVEGAEETEVQDPITVAQLVCMHDDKNRPQPTELFASLLECLRNGSVQGSQPIFDAQRKSFVKLTIKIDLNPKYLSLTYVRNVR